jgi:2-dehydropantoate 2-reductase
MKIAVIGGGSIGLLFAAYLQTRFDVLLYTRTIEQADEINKTGITVHRGVESFKVNVVAKPLMDRFPNINLAIVAVKQYQLESILSQLDGIPNVLFLQNGMGHLKLFEKLSGCNIFVGSVEHGAFREGPAIVSHNGIGATKAAVVKGDGELLNELAAISSTDFQFLIEEDYYMMLASKLSANAVINPLTAILRVPNGELITNPYFEKMLEDLFTEVVDILGFKDKARQLKYVKDICKKTAENRSSMLKDIESGRMTEVDAILGYLLEQAGDMGKGVPLITAFYHMIKGIEWGQGGNT